MKTLKAEKAGTEDPLASRPQLDFRTGVRGKHVPAIAAGSNVVVLDADVLQAFPDSQAVNAALRRLKAHKEAKESKQEHKAVAAS